MPVNLRLARTIASHANRSCNGKMKGVTMLNLWEKPEHREVSVNGECTAYSGSNVVEKITNQRARSTEQSHAFDVRAMQPPVDEAPSSGSTHHV